MSPDATCPECQGGCEDTEHVLRSCRLARSVWRSLLPEVLAGAEANSDFSEWWIKGVDKSESNLSFGVIAWLLWRRRNSLVFNEEKLSVSEVCCQAKFRIHLYSSSWKALQASREAPSTARQARLIGWRPTEEGWYSLNSDGSLYKNPTSSAAGGIIRDDNGRFIAAFSANLGVCSIMRYELRAIVEGMKLAWSKGVRRLRIQTDSKAAVAMLSKPYNANSQHAGLIEHFSELSSRDWQISIHHIYREANCAADHLANRGHSFGLGIHVFEFPDVSLQYWLSFDLVGSCTPRLIFNTT
ncbi:Putative ribonuclease H protein At1g65750 [Linum perenne]